MQSSLHNAQWWYSPIIGIVFCETVTSWGRIVLETLSRSAGQLLFFNWIRKVYYNVRKSPLLHHVWSHINPVHIFTVCFFKIHFNIIRSFLSICQLFASLYFFWQFCMQSLFPIRVTFLPGRQSVLEAGSIWTSSFCFEFTMVRFRLLWLRERWSHMRYKTVK
jgi:hypothetical protein